MESKYVGVHLPAGCTVSVGDSVADLQDVGVLPIDTDSNLEITYDKINIQGSKKETVLNYVKNMAAKATTELYQIRMDVINKLTGGVMTVTPVAGDPVVGVVQSIAAGWSIGRLYLLSGQNSNGTKQTLASVKSGATVLVSGTDYVQGSDASGKWGIIMISDADAPTGTAIDVTYGYTPAASMSVQMGAPVVEITPRIVRFLKMQDGKKYQVTLYSALLDGSLKLSFPGADADKPASLPVTISGMLDPDRAEGSQLLDIVDEIGVE
ncbi:hypothetical protein [uncultured Sphaerochaeta sp.]|uniref:hypothetical protein n=1 Tax=uncultured Sphaerochaeta sp. TaxID=886478 RepID=UPI002A0A1F33|nr:hypothetical protein [uncultured Sphaerochaeta sp.]